MLASEADREATQDVLKKAFEDERLTQDEFEARIGKAVAARTVGECAALTQDIPRPAAPVQRARSSRLIWLLGGGIAVVAIVVAVIATSLSSSGPAQPARAAPAAGSGGGGNGGGGNSGPAPTGAAQCPVGTSATAQTIADALTTDPVYVDPGSTLVTPAQAVRLEAEIAQVDPARIRVAVVTPATVRAGGGERALANAIANCQLTAAGATIVTTTGNTFIVTTYNSNPASQALGAALNEHAGLAAGLKDGIKRLATVDKDSS